MTTPNTRTELALHRLAESQVDIDEAVAAHHKAFVAALKAGCTQAQLSATLGVSRQAINQYVNRWLLATRAEPNSRQGTLL